ARTGAASTTRSAPAIPASASPASMVVSSISGHARRAASCTDAPINPLPAIATRLNGGSVIDIDSPARLPHGYGGAAAAPCAEADGGHYTPQPRRDTGSRQ